MATHKITKQKKSITIQIGALRYFSTNCILFKIPQTQLLDWSSSNYIAGGNMGGNSEAN